MNKNENPHRGHRQKVRARYYANGLNGMPDHNVLEFLLFFGIPQKDTNALAHALLERFGSFAGVLQANAEQLKDVKGMTENAACLLTLFLPVYQRYLTDLSAKKPVFKTAKELADYMRPQFIDSQNERVFLLCFNESQRLIAMRCIAQGGLNQVMLDMRQMASAVLETNAKAAILVHNHPNGIALPSPDDLQTTKTVSQMLATLKVPLLNHVIITDQTYFSMIEHKQFIQYFY